MQLCRSIFGAGTAGAAVAMATESLFCRSGFVYSFILSCFTFFARKYRHMAQADNAFYRLYVRVLLGNEKVCVGRRYTRSSAGGLLTEMIPTYFEIGTLQTPFS